MSLAACPCCCDRNAAHMASTMCHCEPKNSRICCDSTTCSLNRGVYGNHLVGVEQEFSPSPLRNPSITFRISHVAGFPAAFCEPSLNGVLACLFCGTFLYPFLLTLWTCCAIETTVKLWRNGKSVDGSITRRSACCSWYTSVASVTKVDSEELSSDAEGAARVHLHFSSGAAKIVISDGPVPGLKGQVSHWLHQTLHVSS